MRKNLFAIIVCSIVACKSPKAPPKTATQLTIQEDSAKKAFVDNYLNSTSGNLSTSEESSIYKMHVVFKGNPDEEVIKKLIEAVMLKYEMPITEDNALHVGNMLVTLSNASAVGVTEMDI